MLFSDLLALLPAALFGMVANRMFAFTSEPGLTRVQSMVLGEPFVVFALQFDAELVELVAVFVEWLSWLKVLGMCSVASIKV